MSITNCWTTGHKWNECKTTVRVCMRCSETTSDHKPMDSRVQTGAVCFSGIIKVAIDSAATNHTVQDLCLLKDTRPYSASVQGAAGGAGEVKLIGTLDVFAPGQRLVIARTEVWLTLTVRGAAI
ncbi:hypothetical protein SeMB42_g04507 [Synchytrium endobioticum]|uniref:Uncharacterized protein n=1 Tax=Synchytrium endobioticum TaxID=286115 RepID=A0A507CXS1_9FUNG|nr:hypothetical protein SeMB42_g04507 [Synchytrium endobioticum]